MNALAAIVGRELKLAVRVGGSAFIGVLFFLAVVVALPFAIGPDLNLLRRLGPAILWIGALLSSLLAHERLFAQDAEDGTLDLYFTAHSPLELIAAAKAFAHWLSTGVPLVAAAPILALLLNLEPAAIAAVVATLLVGTPALTFLGLVGAAIAVALRRGGLLVAVLILPLSVPVLIFGIAAANAAVVGGAPFGPAFTILCALSLFAAVLGPVAAAAILRAGLD